MVDSHPNAQTTLPVVDEPEMDPLAATEREVTILFSDIVSFTKMSENLQPADLAAFVRDYLTAMTEIIRVASSVNLAASILRVLVQPRS